MTLKRSPDSLKRACRTSRTIHHAGSLEDDVERLLPAGTRSVSVFIVNQNPWHDGAQADATYLFQVAMHLNFAHGFVARPNPRGRDAREEFDELIADLQ